MQNLTRRQAMAGGGAVIALVSSSPAISSPAMRPDAAIVAAIEKFYMLEDRLCDATEAADNARFAWREKTKRPPIMVLSYMFYDVDGIYRWLPGNLSALRRLKKSAKTWPPGDPRHRKWKMILEGWECYDRQCAVPVQLEDVEQLEAKQEEAHTVSDAALEQVVATLALSLPGVIRKFEFLDEFTDLSETKISAAKGDPEPLRVTARLFISAMADLKRLASV